LLSRSRFLSPCYPPRRHLHSFPTRRSSDLAVDSGFGALEQVRRRHFDLIFMDVQMPGMDGLKTTEAIRAWETEQSRAQTPIVARSEEHTSELQSRENLVCRLLLEKKKTAAK